MDKRAFQYIQLVETFTEGYGDVNELNEENLKRIIYKTMRISILYSQ